MKEFLFSYGTLQKAEVQMKLFGRSMRGSQDTLAGYRVLPIEIRDERFLASGEDAHQMTAVISAEGDVIDGTALEVTADELVLADKYEPEGYTRVSVRLGSGKLAWIYTAAG